MKVLSIDVGIKNLALCLFNITSDTCYSIDTWCVSNLCCENKISCSICEKSAKYTYNNVYYCKKHVKNSGHDIIPVELEINKLKKNKIADLKTILNNHKIQFDNTKSKILIIEEIQHSTETEFAIPFNNTIKTTDLSLIDIGINLKNEMDKLFKNIIIDTIIIENQISPIANRMKTLQGMIAQYFIMNNVTDIHFISAANKLKDFLVCKQTTYSERKKKGIDVCEEILINNHLLADNLNTFITSKKKDDLADCFLQGLWFLKEKLHINL
jgi:hypothetical protein